VQHVTGLMLEQQAGIRLVHVPYKGTGPATVDLLGGRIDIAFATPAALNPQIRAGKLRALAVTDKHRLPSLPDVPTVAEAGMPGLDAVSSYALYAPASTPKAVIAQLSASVRKIMQSDAMQQMASEQGVIVDYLDAEQLDGFTRREFDRWAEFVKAARMQID
jgi:tripartite-type tricarboxylate transporter receptor subunit TctC